MKEITDFIQQISGFDALTTREKILIFGWHLHRHAGLETFSNSDIRNCFRKIDSEIPEVSVYLPRLADKKPAELIKIGVNYKLEGSVKRSMDARYNEHPSTIAVSKILSELPGSVPNIDEKVFLKEALDCYRVGAFRASIVMTWNLVLDHLINWILSDKPRLAAFNSAIVVRYPKKTDVAIKVTDDFSDLKEAEIIEVCRTANLLTKNMSDILRDKLKRRNLAAHPSHVVITQHQADDMITDLINNIVLALA